MPTSEPPASICRGLRMTVQPAARAGAAFCVPRVSGPLNGGISAATPTGSRNTSDRAAGPALLLERVALGDVGVHAEVDRRHRGPVGLREGDRIAVLVDA